MVRGVERADESVCDPVLDRVVRGGVDLFWLEEHVCLYGFDGVVDLFEDGKVLCCCLELPEEGEDLVDGEVDAAFWGPASSLFRDECVDVRVEGDGFAFELAVFHAEGVDEGLSLAGDAKADGEEAGEAGNDEDGEDDESDGERGEGVVCLDGVWAREVGRGVCVS